ncbi:MAG: cytochrome c1 [Rhodospirillales bacterium]|nr:cytochrome c1 [Rhodospirillales bacterium]
MGMFNTKSGLAFSAVVIAAGLWLGAPTAAVAASGGTEIEHQKWRHGGPFGTFDRAAMQRGLQVYREVCAACHSLDLVAFRTLSDTGLTEDEIKELAAEYEVADGPDDEGEMFDRPGLPSDIFVGPYANEKAGRASNNGAFPPDLSLITKARPGGEDYLYALLTGYEEAPEDFDLGDGMTYNTAFTDHQIAMPSPLYEDAVEYDDETEATVEQMARDVSVFLTWTAEPALEARKRMGVKVLIFLGIMMVLLFFVKRQVWSDVH